MRRDVLHPALVVRHEVTFDTLIAAGDNNLDKALDERTVAPRIGLNAAVTSALELAQHGGEAAERALHVARRPRVAIEAKIDVGLEVIDVQRSRARAEEAHASRPGNEEDSACSRSARTCSSRSRRA